MLLPYLSSENPHLKLRRIGQISPFELIPSSLFHFFLFLGELFNPVPNEIVKKKIAGSLGPGAVLFPVWLFRWKVFFLVNISFYDIEACATVGYAELHRVMYLCRFVCVPE